MGTSNDREKPTARPRASCVQGSPPSPAALLLAPVALGAHERIRERQPVGQVIHVARTPIWSQVLTVPVARRVPVDCRPAVLAAIKGLHTVIFASVGWAILLFVWEGFRQRPGRRAAGALGVVLAESAIYASNNQVCPFTPLAEELGAKSGSVADIFLPDWFSRRIPLFGGGALVLGLVLNAHA